MPEILPRTIVKINSFSFYRPRLAPVFVALLLVSLLSLLFVWSRIHAINLEYSISRLQKQIRGSQQQIKQLELEAAFLARNKRIEELATRQLGMRPPAPGQIIRVD